ncbi:MAG: succinylglutamate desuccinylase/aspartoacylase family protein, partial [Moorea sp. SIO3I7]|nr:succinylglutamate desuccinylase/aspartoacylase family protein [Moorena sp. SIO3I7]
DANYVIDIHSSTNQGLDFLYGFYSREESAKDFLLDYGIVMHEDEYDGDAFDEAFIKPWQGLEKALAKLGRTLQFDIESWTLELGSGMQMNPESVKNGVYGIKNYLSKKGMLKLPDLPITDPDSYKMQLASKDNIERYYAPAGGMIQSRVKLGSVVKVGDRLYQLLSFNKEGNLPNVIDIKAETDGLVFDVSTNYSANQGEYVLSIRQFDN